MTNQSIAMYKNMFLPEFDLYCQTRKSLSTNENDEMKLLNVMIENGGKIVVDIQTQSE